MIKNRKNRMYLIPIVLLLLIGCNGGSSVIPTPTPIINQISRRCSFDHKCIYSVYKSATLYLP
jgi:hypothetical protein